jgi:hypothetical protein
MCSAKARVAVPPKIFALSYAVWSMVPVPKHPKRAANVMNLRRLSTIVDGIFSARLSKARVRAGQAILPTFAP